MFNYDWKYITLCTWLAVGGWSECLLIIYWTDVFTVVETESGNQLSKMRSLARIRPAFTSDSIYAK